MKYPFILRKVKLCKEDIQYDTKTWDNRYLNRIACDIINYCQQKLYIQLEERRIEIWVGVKCLWYIHKRNNRITNVAFLQNLNRDSVEIDSRYYYQYMNEMYYKHILNEGMIIKNIVDKNKVAEVWMYKKHIWVCYFGHGTLMKIYNFY